jgi:hypothetical protein
VLDVTPLENVCAENAAVAGDAVDSDAEGLAGPVGDVPLHAVIASSAAEIAGPITNLVIAKKLRGGM